jgi:hypothetical protein
LSPGSDGAPEVYLKTLDSLPRLPLMITELTSKSEPGRPETSSDVFIEVADVTVNLVGGGDPQPEVVGAMSRFVVPAGEPDVTIHTSWGELGDENHGRQLFDSGSLWQLYEEDAGYRFRLAGVRPGQSTYKIARFNQDFTRGEVVCDPRRVAVDEPLYPLQYPLDELLLINLLARGRGVEFHACGVSDRGRCGYLFVGHSEAGKTTSARLWQKQREAELLSDDRVIVRERGGKFWMYGTPWHGEEEISSPLKVQLTHIFILRHGHSNEIAPLKKAEAAAELFSRSFPTFYDPEGLEFTLEFLGRLTEAVPCAELSFVPDERVIGFVRSQTT